MMQQDNEAILSRLIAEGEARGWQDEPETMITVAEAIKREGIVIPCECSSESYDPRCEVGKQLDSDCWCGFELISSPSFLSRPVEEREQIWQQYNEVVDRYIAHCEQQGTPRCSR